MEKPGRFCTVAVIAAMLAILGGCGQKPHPVHISSEPAGALVFLNDKVIGETPFDTLVEQRTGDYNMYTFKVLKKDYIPAKRAFKEQLYHETASDLIPSDLHFILEREVKEDKETTKAGRQLQ